jgi:hypothetical protein
MLIWLLKIPARLRTHFLRSGREAASYLSILAGPGAGFRFARNLYCKKGFGFLVHFQMMPFMIGIGLEAEVFMMAPVQQ